MIKILWADDEIDLLKPHIIYLEEKGYNLTPAKSGDEALDILKSKKRGNYIILKGKPMNNEQFMEYREIYGICLSQEVNKAKVQSKSLLNNIKTRPINVPTMPNAGENVPSVFIN